ncbi:MAG TPA: hypothetical protein DEQ61_14980 [Streptomyces sp.]|nr:hypothetical protein [Streptomyces sp.]
MRKPRERAGSQARTRRVVVVSPQTRLALARRTRSGRRVLLPADFDAGRARAVHAGQRRLAVVSMTLLAALLFGLPLLLSALPALSRARWGEVPVSWLLLGVAVHPALLALGWAHMRAAERTEAREERRR